MIRIFQIKCASDDKVDIQAQILKKLHMQKKDLFSWCIHRKSVDARGQKVLFSYTVDASVRQERKYLKRKDVQLSPDETYTYVKSGFHTMKNRPVVIGFGPAGMFASLILAQSGYKPIVIERGSEVHQRKKTVEHFWKTGDLDTECNVQFGQGGAGAFSDGKLTTRSKDKRCRKVLEELVRFGASEDILIDQYPHVGTDAFIEIVDHCRKEIEALGGTFCFDARLDDIHIADDRLAAICVNGKWIDCQNMLLACGHSAKDTIMMLYKHGIHLENKRFAVGVRIEHKQAYINQIMLKSYAHDERLIPARYRLSHMASNGKGVYTFCMCPGGYVIAASSQKEQTVINGMSYAARSGENANSALLVQVDESDYGRDLFAGLRYQEDLEKKAYALSNGFCAPVQLADDYVNGRVSTAFKDVKPTYALGTRMADLNQLFSNPVNLALHEALCNFEERIPGFISSGAILSAVESRSSSSIRIWRNDQYGSSIPGIYPCGEGSGYAGGIMTSAIDGIKCAEKLIEYYNKPESE